MMNEDALYLLLVPLMLNNPFLLHAEARGCSEEHIDAAVLGFSLSSQCSESLERIFYNS